MTSSYCPYFSQNAWKKDLCSNCFKSKSEHKQSFLSATSKFSTFSTTAKHMTEIFPILEREQNKTDYLSKKNSPSKSIIKKSTVGSSKNKLNKVSFSKNIFEVIGFGGEWSETESDDEEHNMLNLGDEPEDSGTTSPDDEAALELKRITKSNTDFNMNNGNFLGDPQDNIKKSFAALKLGAPLVDKMGRKQTLKINVVPFGSTTVANEQNSEQQVNPKLNSINKTHAENKIPVKTQNKSKLECTKQSSPAISTQKIIASSTSESSHFSFPLDGKNSPPIERAMEKSLLDEISETLKQKQNETKKIENETTDCGGSSQCSETLESKRLLELKKPIARNSPITKAHVKPKVNIFHKYSDTDSNCSDNENYVSAYYDVVEAQASYEDTPDGQFNPNMKQAKIDVKNEQAISSDPSYISDILMSSKTRAASYNLHEGNFITSKLTSDGLIVTKCSSDDNLDSTGSSFDGSSDDETLYNITRSESDSGIGINVGHDYKNVPPQPESDLFLAEKKLNLNFNNSDYEDIQINNAKAVKVNTPINSKTQIQSKNTFSLNKCRELHGEPDGSADPDGNLEKIQSKQETLPAHPKVPPPKTINPCSSFLYGLQKQQQTAILKKPNLPAKPLISPTNKTFKTFISKRQNTDSDKVVISQVQLDISQPIENISIESMKDDMKFKKGKAPNPPGGQKACESTTMTEPMLHTPEEKGNKKIGIIEEEKSELTTNLKALNEENQADESKSNKSAEKMEDNQTNATSLPKTNNSPPATMNTKLTLANTYTRNTPKAPCVDAANNKNLMKEKEKRDRVVMNPKFRSLNTVLMQRSNVEKNLQLQSATSVLNIKQQLTPELTLKIPKCLSMSEECLTALSSTSSAKKFSYIPDKKSGGSIAAPAQKTKTKFSIKRFLRIGASKTTDNLCKKEGIYSEICTGEETGVVGKPRLVIIHPIDINPTTVEVVKDIKQTNATVSAQMTDIMNSNLPAPQIINRSSLEKIKPVRPPPPPKSAELRRKQDKELTIATNQKEINSSTNSKYNNIYANLGEIRSCMAPRKPERSASMRDNEHADVTRKRHFGTSNEKSDNTSICSSNGDNDSTETCSKNGGDSSNDKRINSTEHTLPVDTSKTSKNIENINNKSLFIKTEWGPCSLKKSVRKVNNTIDNYLKDKHDYEPMYEIPKAASTCNSRSAPFRSDQDLTAGQRLVSLRLHNLYSDTASISSYPRSEQSPCRPYGINTNFSNIQRTVSALYCGSEAGEFDIYSPYSYCGSEVGIETGNDLNGGAWSNHTVIKNCTKTTSHLRMRKGRSVVHKNMEDNYAAVVVANYEALVQVLDQLQQSPVIPTALRSLANVLNLRFEDFTVIDCGQAFVVGGKAFHAALWTNVPVTLALSADCNQLAGVGGDLNKLLGGIPGVSHPITEFSDLVPSYHLPLMPTTEATLMQATVTVLPRLQLDTLQSIGNLLKSKSDVLINTNNVRVQNLLSEEPNNIKSPRSFDDIMTREIAFIMLQLVNGMKNLQVNAIEEMPLSLSNVVLSKDVDNKDAPARLSVLQFKTSDEDEPLGTLCKCGNVALKEMLPTTKITPILTNIFLQERAESLSKAKSVLEFILWGPSDVPLCGSIKERELALQRWLDLERATVLHGLVRSRVELTVYDECHLIFLVRSSAKMMNDAAKIITDFEEQQHLQCQEHTITEQQT